MKFEQLHYFSSQNVGRDKKYYVPPVQKLGGTCPPRSPIKSVPGGLSRDLGMSRIFIRKHSRALQNIALKPISLVRHIATAIVSMQLVYNDAL